ncbi:MAG: hypothetical protein K6G03_08805 [Lachnospiraceae bacterium]|nr:hypothetical protein [Lachnospiraceae bacterium]
MTLFTSDDRIKNINDSAFWHFMFAFFCGVFGAIYEVFSHEVYSFFMIYAFAIPLIFGCFLPRMIVRIAVGKGIRLPDRLTMSFYNMAVVTCTIGAVFKGVLEIYGTTNRLIIVYPVAAGVLVILAIVRYYLGIDDDNTIYA